MVFSGIPFLYCFLPAAVLLYFLTPKPLKNTALLLSSLVFYAWGEQLLVLLFAGAILFHWLLGLLLERLRSPGGRRALLAAAVITDLSLLGYFKYTDFFIGSFNGVSGGSIPLLHIALPVGISFYVFQLMSYLIDIYRKDVPAQRNPIDFAAYVSFFPQLIAGPIVRYGDVAQQLKHRSFSLEQTALGVRRFLIGLGKKVLLADTMAALCVSFRAAQEQSVLYFWLYAFAFFFQIYFDFSGYSDMAIGLGRVFGFTLPENFRYPYLAKSITEFWRRWHMTLGSWFRDYVYIPMGGSRKGLPRQICNLLAVWMLTGLWHGAAWNFVLWGLYFAILLLLEKLFLHKLFQRCPALGHIWTVAAVLLGFVLFNGESLAQVWGDVSGLFAFGQMPLWNGESLYALRSFGAVFLLAAVGCTPLPKLLAEQLGKTRWGLRLRNLAEPFLLLALLLTVTAFLVDGTFQPFLYFRF